MRLTIRLVGAIWLSVLIVIGGFAFLQIREERERLVDDLKRRAVLVGEGLKEAIEPQVARDSTAGALVVILDAAHLEGAAWNLWWSNALRFLALALVVSLIALVVVRSSVTQPMAKMSEWTKSLRAGRYVPPPDVPDANVFGPLAREVAGLARSMQRARAAAEQEAALRLVGESIWTEERLKP